MEDAYKKLIHKLQGCGLKKDETLARYTTLKLGGPADLFIVAKTQSQLIQSISEAWSLSIPVFVMGGGTNTLVTDKGFRGLVVKNETNSLKFAGMKGVNESATVYLEAESGVGVNRLVRYALDQGLSGLETFLGQPGTVGGAMWINAHNMKSGTFFSDCVTNAKILTKNRGVVVVDRSYFRFGYDTSRIQKTEDIVISVTLALSRGDKRLLWENASEVVAYRRATQPPGAYSAGCVFQNIKKSDAVRVATSNYTRSAGYILDRLGFKGKSVGGARFSQTHANFITHDGNCSAADMVELISLAKRRVKEHFNIVLKEEIRIVGDS